jgi:hypothetical protein
MLWPGESSRRLLVGWRLVEARAGDTVDADGNHGLYRSKVDASP